MLGNVNMIVAAGEALIDMVKNRDTKDGFISRPGGSAYNVACALGLLEQKIAFVCPISNDPMGQLLQEQLQQCGVELILKETVNAPTPLALVTLDHDNQAHYSFYRQGTADRMVATFDMEKAPPSTTKILHITGFCLNEAEDYHHWMKIVTSVKELGGIISVDPNVRADLITDAEDYRYRIKKLLALADVVKVSDEDLQYLYNDMTLEQAKQHLQKITLLSIITLGSKGAEAFTHNKKIAVKAFRTTSVIDTVGAGDCFSAAYLYSLEKIKADTPEKIRDLSEDQIKNMLTFSSVAASINCERTGCQPPRLNEIEALL